MSDQNQINKDLARRLAFMNDRQYSTLADFYADVASPLYSEDEGFRALCDARLEASRHLWENNDHKVTDNLTSGDSVGANFSADENGNVTMISIGDPGEIGIGDVAPALVNDGRHAPELVDTGNSLILNFSTDGDGEGEGE
jgi:hypothetical protein